MTDLEKKALRAAWDHCDNEHGMDDTSCYACMSLARSFVRFAEKEYKDDLDYLRGEVNRLRDLLAEVRCAARGL